jgi:glycosyltransferase involved in cell wall biosynthesis
LIAVHQLLSGAGPRDAVSALARAFRARFRAWGWGGADHAHRLAPGLDGSIGPFAALRADPADVLLVHHSAGWPRLEELLALPNPKLLLYHNVTPAEWLWEVAPVLAAHCAAGREQLPELVAHARLAAGLSSFSVAELKALGAARTAVLAPLIDLGALGPPSAAEAQVKAPASAPAPASVPVPAPASVPVPASVLFVGRLSPHKRQEELIEMISLYRREHDPRTRLVLVGDPASPDYLRRLAELAKRRAPGAVSIQSSLSPSALGERYRSARAFVCLSVHEGFCLPLLEAMHFGVPVIARPAGAVPEVLGDAGLLVEDHDPAVLCELLHLVLTDRELREQLRSRGLRQLERFSPARAGELLREAVLEVAGG